MVRALPKACTNFDITRGFESQVIVVFAFRPYQVQTANLRFLVRLPLNILVNVVIRLQLSLLDKQLLKNGAVGRVTAF